MLCCSSNAPVMHRTTGRRPALETLIALIAFLLCVVVPIALVIALIVWIVRKISAGSPAAIPTHSLGQAAFDEFNSLVLRWAAQGRLSSDVAAQVRALIAEERLSHAQSN